MARNQQLGETVTKLRHAVGNSPEAAHGVATKSSLVEKINSVQQFLYDEYDWPFLTVREDKTISAGQRYYDIPSALSLEQIEEIWIKYSGIWTEITDCRGIEMDHYNVFNSDDDVRADPAQRWDIIYTGSSEQIELWPLPASNATNSLRVIGKKDLTALIADSDLLMLDDYLVVFMAAAELLGEDTADGQRYAAMARGRMARLRSLTGGRKKFNLSAGGEKQSQRRRSILVAVDRSS